jgi:hypothetical protein
VIAQIPLVHQDFGFTGGLEMRILLGLLGAIVTSFPGIADTCKPFKDMQGHVLTNFSQLSMETQDKRLSSADSFPGAARCQLSKADEKSPVADMQCYWSRDVQGRFTALLQELKTCYPNWQQQEQNDPDAVQLVHFKQDNMRAGLWIVQLYNAKTRVILRLTFMQKVRK